MRKIIHHRKYDTDTAAVVGSWDNDMWDSDFDWVEETLYRKRNGEYFVHGHGGARTRYAVADGQNSWCGGGRIMPLAYDAAREWAEGHLDVDEYEAEFGEVPEGDEGAMVSTRVSAAAKRALEREAQRTGESQTAVLERLLMSLREG